MANAANELLVFGDGFEGILKMLEEDEAIEEHLLTAAIEWLYYMRILQPESAMMKQIKKKTLFTLAKVGAWKIDRASQKIWGKFLLRNNTFLQGV